MKPTIESGLIAAGVKNLKAFGYPNCTAENILTDAVFSQFFASMLESNKGKRRDVDVVIDALLAKIAKSGSQG